MAVRRGPDSRDALGIDNFGDKESCNHEKYATRRHAADDFRGVILLKIKSPGPALFASKCSKGVCLLRLRVHQQRKKLFDRLDGRNGSLYGS